MKTEFIDSICHAAWSVLNHDNNYDGNEEHIVGPRENLRRAVAKLVFGPLGDNHHNAAQCPYCTHGGKFTMVPADRIEALEAALLKAKRGHYYCDDPWYSCPLAEDGCADPQYEKDKCNCGADDFNAKIDTLLSGSGVK